MKKDKQREGVVVTTIRIPTSLHTRVAALAEKAGSSFNSIAVDLIEEGYGVWPTK